MDLLDDKCIYYVINTAGNLKLSTHAGQPEIKSSYQHMQGNQRSSQAINTKAINTCRAIRDQVKLSTHAGQPSRL